METYFLFLQCSKCGTTWVHVYEEAKRQETDNDVTVYFYETCLQCSSLDPSLAMRYFRTSLGSWDAFRLPLCN